MTTNGLLVVCMVCMLVCVIGDVFRHYGFRRLANTCFALTTIMALFGAGVCAYFAYTGNV